MGKYNHLRILKKVKARINHIYTNCNSAINKDDVYFIEQLDDKFLHTLNRKKFCINCYEKYGDKLLKETSSEKASKSLTDF